MLTESLTKVFHEIENLSDKEQDEISILLNSELNWSKKFKTSQSLLSELANEALAEHR
jgi:hypothetical protein